MEFLVIIGIIGAIIWYYTKKEINKPAPKYQPILSPIQTVIHTQDKLFEPTRENKQIMQALVFIGKADGQLRENECDVVAEYLKFAQKEHLTTDTSYIAFRARELKNIEYIEYKKTLKNMNKPQAEVFFMWASRVVNTQDKIHPFEEVLLDNIKEHIQQSK